MANTITNGCNGCSACMHQCPVQAIFQESTDQFRIITDLCIECDVCGIVCPVEAVLDAAGERIRRIPRDQRLRPVVDDVLCNGCGVCVDVCPFDCLSVIGPQYFGVAYLSVPDACVTCAECVTHCIKGAIAMGDLNIRKYDADAEAARLRAHVEQPA